MAENMSEQIRRVAVWSGWGRVAHWVLAGATLLLLATGWLIGNAPSLAAAAVEVHYLGAALLLFALALRLFLGLFGRGVDRFDQLLPRASERQAMRQSLWFYLSLGRAPKPNWFAHNPLWKPLYLLMLTMLTLLVASGWLMPETPLLGGLYLPKLHGWLAVGVGMLCLAHLFSVVLQDLKGHNADVSAMISGSRYFIIEREGLVKPEIPQVSVRLGDIHKP